MEIPSNLASLDELISCYRSDNEEGGSPVTGRSLVSLREDAEDGGLCWLLKYLGHSDLAERGSEAGIEGISEEMIWFREIGVVLVRQSPQVIRGWEGSGILAAIEDEGFVTNWAESSSANSSTGTWGLEATGTIFNSYTGLGVSLAVLDTGLVLEHRHFSQPLRIPPTELCGFVKNPQCGSDAEDRTGHGTLCAGIAAGPAGFNPRYGVAPDTSLYIGKVLTGKQGELKGGKKCNGVDSWVLSGINWAISKEVDIVSMSVFAASLPGDSHKVCFEKAATKGLNKRTLLVAAGGNSSNRDSNPPVVEPVGHPANCPSVLAVGAIYGDGCVAWFSPSFVDLVAPGVYILTSGKYEETVLAEWGTSLATPFVAGIAALYLEAFRRQNLIIKPRQLWRLLLRKAYTGKLENCVGISASDYGYGLVQAPEEGFVATKELLSQLKDSLPAPGESP